MIYLLDTNVISEQVKKQRNPGVIEWLSTVPISHMALSVLTLGEIRKGIEGLLEKKRKDLLIQWLEIDLIEKFKHQIISIDTAVADKWGYLCGLSKTTTPAVDGLIAASALVHNLKLVTRNQKDFERFPGLEIINPWS